MGHADVSDAYLSRADNIVDAHGEVLRRRVVTEVVGTAATSHTVARSNQRSCKVSVYRISGDGRTAVVGGERLHIVARTVQIHKRHHLRDPRCRPVITMAQRGRTILD